MRRIAVVLLLSGLSGSALAARPGQAVHLSVKPDGRLFLCQQPHHQQRVSAPGPRGFAYQPFAAKGAARLRDRLKQLRPSKITIRFAARRIDRRRGKTSSRPGATPRWTSLDLVSLLAEIEAAGVRAWELQVGRRRCASLLVLGSKAAPQIEASDLRLSNRTDARGVRWINTSSLSRRKGRTPRRVRLLVNFGTSITKLCKILGRADGDQVALSIHTGPF